MRNRLPSLLTAARFPLALGLLAAEVSTRFLALYLLCCLTDVLDGLAARRLNACSAFGARLDSAADLAVTAVLVWRLWPPGRPGSLADIVDLRRRGGPSCRGAGRPAALRALWLSAHLGKQVYRRSAGSVPLCAGADRVPLDVGHRPHRGQPLVAGGVGDRVQGGTVGAGPARSVGKKIRSGSFMDRQAVLEWVQRQYGTLPDDPWARYPHYAVLRSPAVNGMA